ncbi:MAG: hypothetical protein JWO46_2496 [Nocardioidaceae bacterium]|nr:hypothetical protein [Nocardioidaceae bacterium]
MRRHLGPCRTHDRTLSLATVLALVAALLAFLPVAPAAAAGPQITQAKTGDSQALVGSPVSYTLTMANPSQTGAVPEYNVSFRDVLPTGVTYVAGSTGPASIGEPTVTTTGGIQTLVWANVSDLPVGASQALTFKALPAAATYPVGASVTNTANGYAQTNPRLVPKFTAGVASGFTQSATSPAKTTTITALTVRKSEPSPEHELLRGVHDQSTVYTLTVTNNAGAATNTPVVVDYLPAQLEFLGCGTADNTAGTTVEYPGAPRLDASTPDVTASCPAPASVDTVTLSAGNAQNLDPGVYTVVTWNLASLAAGAVTTISYRAGIPQRANAAFVGGPTAASGRQAANLDNNTGASTRETATEQSLKNLVTVAGTYQGTVASGTSATVTDSDSVTVTAEDLALQKSVGPGTFTGGGVATYTLKLEAGEYTDDSAIVLTDTLPDGLCPLSTTANYAPGAPAECAAGASFGQTGATFSSVVHNANGTYTIVFNPVSAVPHNGTATVTFKARMRASYQGTGTDPTVSGDSYVNNVSTVGTTTVRPTVDAPAPAGVLTDVRDDSSATLTSDGPTLKKTIKPTVTPITCALDGSYTDNTAAPATSAPLTFREGDRVCFKIRVDFSSSNATKNATVTDFLPADVTFVTGTDTRTANDTVTSVLDTTTTNPLTWTVGTTQGSNRFVAPNGIFEHTVATTVTTPPTGTVPDITANLAKLSYTNTAGTVGFLRDQVGFTVAPAPPLAVAKTAAHADGSVAANNGNVVGGETLTVSVGVTNNGTAATGNNVPAVGPDVWDVLPAGVTCGLISVISDGGVCTNPGDAGQPTFTSRATLSAIRWNLPDSQTIAPAAIRTLTYKMTVPTDPPVGTKYLNTASVASYATADDLGGVDPHFPATNVDTTVLPAQVDTTAATGSYTAVIKPVALSKVATTAITDGTVNTATQAVIGEGITYTLQLTVPAHTTVFNETLTDPMTTGVELLSATATFSANNGTSYSATLPSGVGLSTTPGVEAAGTTTLSLGTTYVNTSAVDQIFRVVVSARATTRTDNTQGVARTNTATSTNTLATDPASTKTTLAKTAAVTVVEPSPALAKTDNTVGHEAVGGQTITYTLTASDAAGRPTLRDSYVIDCVPNGLTVTGIPTIPAGDTATSFPGTGSNGCASDQTVVRWEIGDLSAAAPAILKYTATVTNASAGLRSYQNNATLSGGSLADGTDPTTAIERPYTATATDTVTISGALFAKATSTPTRAVGQRATFTTTATLPANVNFYDTAFFDTLPASLDASSVVLTNSSCTPACTVSPTQLSTAGQQIGWSIGDFAQVSAQRIVTLTYTALVTDVAGNVAGTTLTNNAHLGWDLANGSDKTSATDATDRSSTTAPATVTVTEPKVQIAKSVNDAAPVPGEHVTYTLQVSNAAVANVSDAYDVAVSDVVPAGVVVEPGTISNGGTLTGCTSAGGGTISWLILGPLSTSTPVALTYQAHLASPTPTGTLTNTASVTGYHSISGGGRSYTGPSSQASIKAALPHVTVAKSVVGGPLAYVGQAKAWRVTVTSDGSSRAFGIDVADTLPHNWTYQPGSAQVSVRGTGPTQVDPVTSGSAASGQKLTWTNLGDLPNRNDTIVVTFSAVPGAGVTTDPGVGDTVDHTNTAATTAEDANGAQAAADGTAYNGPPATAVAHVDSADLQVTKTPVGSPVAGQDFSWHVTVANNGPDPAVGPVTVTDTMPGQLTSVTASGTGWTCGGTAPVACTRNDTLASGSSYPVITVTGHVPPTIASGTTVTNQVGVAGKTYDPRASNDTASSSATVATDADLRITKQLSGSMVAGSVATYTLDVTNLGPSVHSGTLTVTDPVPAGTTYVGATGTGWTCGQATGTVTCTRSDAQPVGALDQITVQVKVDSARTTVVTNKATVDGRTGGTPDSVSGNDSDTVTTTPDALADLSIDKQARGTLTAGRPGTYRLTVHNDGPSDSAGVFVTDPLPTDLLYTGSTSVTGSWTCAATGQAVRCDLAGTLPVGQDAVVDIAVAVDPAHTGTLSNTATVHATTPEPIGTLGNDSDTDTNAAAVESDLRTVKTHPAGNVVAGQDVTYTITVTNGGPSNNAGPIVVTDTLPVGMTCASVAGAACSGRSITYTRPGGLVNNASFDVVVVAHVDPAAGPATLTNQAVVSGPDDPNPINDGAQDPTTVVDRADVRLSKTPTGDTVRAGANKTFTLTAHNDGPSDADNVSVTEQLPVGMSLVSMSGPGWTCPTGTVTCTRPGLAAGADATVTVEVTVDSAVADGTTLTNRAHLDSGTAGNDPANDDASATVDVIARADLTLTKRHVGASPVAAGTSTTYALDVHNDGPSVSLATIRVTDTLPTSFGYVSAAAPWSCSAAGQVVTCDLAQDLAAGADAPQLVMVVDVAADADATADARNDAHVDSTTTTDPDQSDNDAHADVAVTRSAALTVVKSHTGTGRIGSQVVYSLLVSNAGPASARAVQLTDVVPDGLDYVSADGGPTWTCGYATATRTVTCDRTGALGVNQSADPVLLTATVTAAAYPSVTNTAGVDSADSTPTPSNADPLDVPPLVDLSVVKSHRGTLTVGNRSTYTLTVHNDGPTEVPGTVRVLDTLPAGLTYVGATGPGWTCTSSGQQVMCLSYGLADGATSAIELTVDVGPAAYPSVTNTATVTSDAEDGRVGNNASSDPAAVLATVALTVVKKLLRQTPTSATWGIEVTNHGPSDTTAPVTVVDTIPAGLRYVSGTGDGWDCSRLGRRVTCAHATAIAAGASSAVRLITTITAGPGTKIRNTATVGGGVPDGPVVDSSTASLTTPKVGGTAPTGTAGTALPDTGGPPLWPVPVGLLLVAAGLFLALRRTSPAPRHR